MCVNFLINHMDQMIKFYVLCQAGDFTELCFPVVLRLSNHLRTKRARE